MIAFPEQRNPWLFRFRCVLVLVGIFSFFTRLETFLNVQDIFSISIGWYLPFFAASAPLFLLNRMRYPVRDIAVGSILYLCLISISFLLFETNHYSSQALVEQFFSIIFFLNMVFLFSEPRVYQLARYALLFATMIGVLNNVYQMINPTAFGGLYEGRATGIYLDPNDCSQALIAGMILTITMLPKKYHIPWVLFVGLGVALTLSRGGGLIWLISFIVMVFLRIITHKQALWWILGSSLCFLLFISLGFTNSIANIDQVSGDSFERVESIFNGSTLEDGSSLERQGLVRKAWEMFLERPLSGYGIGAASNPNITTYNVSTHNMYVLHLAEFGVVGALIMPASLFLVTRSARNSTKKVGFTFSVFILLTSIFSHTVLLMSHLLISFAMMAVMSEVSRGERRKNLSFQNF